MSDLISRSALIEPLKKHIGEINDDAVKAVYEDFITYIEKCPTAYDRDKVLEQLKELKNRYTTDDFAIRGIVEKTIEIVEMGGVE